MENYKSFQQLMQEAEQAGAFTAEQIEELHKMPQLANEWQLKTLQEVMHRKHSTGWEKAA